MYQLAKDLPLDAPLYSDMRKYGVVCFTIEEYDFADSREELAELFKEAMEQFDGISLKGMKTSLPRTAVYPTSGGALPKAKPAAKAATKSKTASSAKTKSKSKAAVKADGAKAKPKPKPKLSSGRTGSAIKEKRIKEAIALEKEQRSLLKLQQIEEQSLQMKVILGNLDARGSTLRDRS